MKSISSEDVRKVATLARLDLPEEKIATYTSQLESILDYVSQLKAIDTSDIPLTTRAVEVINVTREDVKKSSNNRDKILEQAPFRDGNYFRVPKILT